MEDYLRRALVPGLLAGSITVGTGCRADEEPPPPEAPVVDQNLVMISIDSFRRDHVTRYDPLQRDLTPFLDGLMAEGQVADNTLSCSIWTYHAMPCALSGQYTIDRGMLSFAEPPNLSPWPDGTRTLADDLKDAGFYTVLSSGNGWLGALLGFTDGYYARYDHEFADASTLYDQGVTKLEAALANNPDGRWFLHLHVMEPHAAYAPPPEYLDALDGLPDVGFDLEDQTGHYDAVKDAWPYLTPEEQANLLTQLHIRYEGEVRYLDDQLRTIWADLDARGLLDDTLVVFYADHGEQFYERGFQSHLYSMNLEENDVPWFTWSRNRAPMTVTPRASQVDIVPTILDALDLPIPDAVVGVPMARIPEERALYAEAFGRDGLVNMVQVGEKELIHYWDGRTQLYDRATDPLQATNLYDPSLPDVAALWELLEPRIDIARGIQSDEPYVPPQGL